MVLGLRRLNRRLTRTIPDHVRRAARAALEENAEIIVAEMKRLVPIDRGDVRASIGWRWGGAPEGTSAFGTARAGSETITIYAGGGGAFHAIFQEFGTAKMAPTPFFFPAYRAKRRGAKSRVTRKLKKAIRES